MAGILLPCRGGNRVSDHLVEPRSRRRLLGTVIFDSAAITASYSFTIEGLDFGLATGGLPQTPMTSDDVTRVHFHTAVAGVPGPIVFGQIDANPALNQDNDDLDIVLNPDHSWTVSGIWEQTDPPPSPMGVTINTFAGVLGSATPGTEVPLYFNVHSSDFPGGEIRGQLVAIADDEDNVVEGTAGNDLLPGLGGDDNINGGKGKDILVGGAGNDLLTGGQGLPDLFVFNAGFGKDIITDFKNKDQIQFKAGLFPNPQPESVLMASEQVGNNVVITLDEDNTITLLGVKLSSLQADDFLFV
jgi:serralysin